MKLISFCLWGDNPKYTEGAIKNAELAKEIFPEWTCRFYVGQSVSSIVKMRLEMNDNTQIVEVPEWGNWKGMFWRFWPASEKDAEVIISRQLLTSGLKAIRGFTLCVITHFMLFRFLAVCGEPNEDVYPT